MVGTIYSVKWDQCWEEKSRLIYGVEITFYTKVFTQKLLEPGLHVVLTKSNLAVHSVAIVLFIICFQVRKKVHVFIRLAVNGSLHI